MCSVGIKAWRDLWRVKFETSVLSCFNLFLHQHSICACLPFLWAYIFFSFFIRRDYWQSINWWPSWKDQCWPPLLFLGPIFCKKCPQSVPFINSLLLLLLVARFALLLLLLPHVSLVCGLLQLGKMSLSGALLALPGDFLRAQVRIVRSVIRASCAMVYALWFSQLADVTLSQKLKEELGYEKETGGASKDTPQFLKDFQAQNVWTVSTLLCFRRRHFAKLYWLGCNVDRFPMSLVRTKWHSRGNMAMKSQFSLFHRHCVVTCVDLDVEVFA